MTILKRCGELYDHVIIDSPPILSVTDGVILARQADAVVLVVRHGKSSKHVVRRARDHPAAFGRSHYRHRAECSRYELAGVLRLLRIFRLLVLRAWIPRAGRR